MGSSFIHHKGVGYWTSDTGIEFWLRLLSDKIKAMPDAQPWLREAADYWHLQATVVFQGCVSPDLDKYLAGDHRREIALALSWEIAQDLQGGPPVLSVEWLNSLRIGGPGSFFTNDVPVTAFLGDAARFIALLEGKIVTDARSFAPTEEELVEIYDRMRRRTYPQS